MDGTYYVVVTPPSGATQTYDPDQPSTLPCTTCDNYSQVTVAGADILDRDFAYDANSAIIYGKVWEDNNGNQTQQTGENGFSGVVCNICAGGTDVNVPMAVNRKERELIIRELKRVKSIYPKVFLLSEAMIKWFEYPDHRDKCYWGDEVLHYDVSWNKRRCFGNNADCSNCGCGAGSFQSPLRMLRYPREMMNILVCS